MVPVPSRQGLERGRTGPKSHHNAHLSDAAPVPSFFQIQKRVASGLCLLQLADEDSGQFTSSCGTVCLSWEARVQAQLKEQDPAQKLDNPA